MARTILHADLDAFFVSVEQALAPELMGQPVVVGGRPGGRGVVASASYEARGYGIHAGMPLHQAQRLCPRAIFLPGRFARYQEASERFLDMLAELSPDIEPLGIDEAYMDLTGFEPFYGPARETARRLKERVRRELDITVSVGIASAKVVAKVASDLKKPDGLVEVPPGGERAFLAPLPLARLPGAGPRVREVLRALGVATVGGLAKLPLSFLKEALGVQGEALHSWAQGIDPRPVAAPAPAKSISRSTTLPRNTLDRPFLRAMLYYLGERVGAELRRKSKAARRVTLKLRYEDFETIDRSRTVGRPIATDSDIYGVGWELLERELEGCRKRVRLIGIGVSELVPIGVQLGLLDRGAERSWHLARAVDRVRERFGFSSLEMGRSLALEEAFLSDRDSYLLRTPCLSR
ncbi:MAG: DNA polymerase IV [Chloroflexi bacterium]|nr:DNA polymerase IV [Chloroflexota bacterium]